MPWSNFSVKDYYTETIPPPTLVDKTILKIKYQDRQKCIRPKPPQVQPQRPIFKCLPPQYTMLKAIVLKHYTAPDTELCPIYC